MLGLPLRLSHDHRVAMLRWMSQDTLSVRSGAIAPHLCEHHRQVPRCARFATMMCHVLYHLVLLLAVASSARLLDPVLLEHRIHASPVATSGFVYADALTGALRFAGSTGDIPTSGESSSEVTRSQ